MGEERRYNKSDPRLTHCRTYTCSICLEVHYTLPMGVQGPPYRSVMTRHKNAHHDNLAGFPATRKK